MSELLMNLAAWAVYMCAVCAVFLLGVGLYLHTIQSRFFRRHGWRKSDCWFGWIKRIKFDKRKGGKE